MAGLSSISGVRLDRLSEADVEAAAALSASIGWNQDAADWRRLVALHPEGCVAARLAGELIGTATLISFPAVGRSTVGGAEVGGSTPGHPVPLAWLGMVIASPALRGRGVGSAVTDAALGTLDASSGQVVGLDATELGAPLYRRRGFETVATIDRWAGRLNSLSTTAPSEVRVRLAAADDLTRIVALDRGETGVDRSALLRRLASEYVAAEDMASGSSAVIGVAESGAELVGYVVMRNGRVHRHVGPLVARDSAAVDPLLELAAALAGGSTVLLDSVRGVLPANRLEAHGLKVARTLQRMTRPATKVFHSESVVAAMGFEWG